MSKVRLLEATIPKEERTSTAASVTFLREVGKSGGLCVSQTMSTVTSEGGEVIRLPPERTQKKESRGLSDCRLEKEEEEMVCLIERH